MLHSVPYGLTILDMFVDARPAESFNISIFPEAGTDTRATGLNIDMVGGLETIVVASVVIGWKFSAPVANIVVAVAGTIAVVLTDTNHIFFTA